MRTLEARLSSHRRARNALWLRSCNEPLAAWLAAADPVAIPLEEIPDDGDEWAIEKAWIVKLADQGMLLNKRGHPEWSPRRRGGDPFPAAAA